MRLFLKLERRIMVFLRKYWYQRKVLVSVVLEIRL